MKILITGASGLIGTKLSELCLSRGYEVNYLTTKKDKIQNKPNYKGFYWSTHEDTIDAACIDGVDAIIHLAGASVTHRWTEAYKKEIIKSRVETAALLKRLLLANPNHTVKHFVSASGVSIYKESFTQLHTEESKFLGDDFLSDVVRHWETAADQFKDLGIDVAKLRIGMTLSEKGGALEKIALPIKYNLGAPVATGEHWQSWIHVDDLARIFLHVIENNLEGVYNAVASGPVTNKVLTQRIAQALNKKLWLPKIPSFMIKMMYGEMATIALSSQMVGNNKISSTGFIFKFNNIKNALEDILQ